MLAALLGATTVAHAQAAAPLQGDILQQSVSDWYASASRTAPGAWGVAIADQSGTILWGMGQDQPLIPASTVKLFTTGFARSVLGGEARRATRVVGSGRVDPATGQWVGSWALELNGDPTLERGEDAGPTLSDLARQLAAAGVRRLSGPLKVQSADGKANAVYPAAWAKHHRGRLFAPLVGPLTINENVVSVSVAPGKKVGARAVVVGEMPQGLSSIVSVTARTRKGRRTSLSLQTRADGGFVVTGTIGIRSGRRTLTAVASNPKAVLTAAWGNALRHAGIRWNPKAAAATATATAATPRVLAEVTSPTLDSVASEVNRRSLNIGAELLLQWAGGRENGPRMLMEHIREITGDPDGVYLVDGSGLSYDDRVKPATFISYLAKFPVSAAGRNFPQLLPANGTGTLRRLSTGLPSSGVVRAKTGTLGNAATVVGYLGRPDGVLLVSLMYNGSRTWQARQEQWKLFRLLGANGVVIENGTFQPPELQLGSDDESTPPTWWPIPGEQPGERE